MSNAEQLFSDLLYKIVAKRSLSNPEIKMQPISSGGANYTSQLFLATVSDGDTELNLFAKVAAIGEKMREQAPMQIFDVENKFYTKLRILYEELQDKYNIPEDKRFITPEFYGCNDKLYEEVLVLENLSAKGYQDYDRLKSVDWAYASRAVEELAKFHALSLALKKDNREEYDELLQQWNNEIKAETVLLLKHVIHNTVKAVNEEHRPKVMAFFESFDESFVNEPSKPLRLTVFGHCDYRVSNQMYRVDADGHIHLRVVDYQMIRAAPPVLDLLYFIFTGTDEKFRAQYHEKLLDHYYSELCEAMRRFNIDPEEIYSREDFDEEYRAKLPYGLTVAVFILPLVTVDVENAPEVNEDMDISKMTVTNLNSLFHERINGVVNDFVRWGVL